MKINRNQPLYQGPFEILSVDDNGTVHLTVNSVMNTYNRRRLVSYMSEYDIDHGGECNMWISKKCRKN